MDDLEKYIEMLSSSEAWIRSDAIEKLRISDESSEAVVVALKKACKDPNIMIANAAERALKAAVHLKMASQLGRATPKMQELALRVDLNEDEIKALSETIIVTTIPTIPGKEVKESLGLIYSYVVLGAGLITELTSGIKDLFGVRANDVETRLNEVTEEALSELKVKALARGGNGIVGFDLEVMTYGGAILVVSVSGTVVRL